jgi:hypothetical protein
MLCMPRLRPNVRLHCVCNHSVSQNSKVEVQGEMADKERIKQTNKQTNQPTNKQTNKQTTALAATLQPLAIVHPSCDQDFVRPAHRQALLPIINCRCLAAALQAAAETIAEARSPHQGQFFWVWAAAQGPPVGKQGSQLLQPHTAVTASWTCGCGLAPQTTALSATRCLAHSQPPGHIPMPHLHVQC